VKPFSIVVGPLYIALCAFVFGVCLAVSGCGGGGGDGFAGSGRVDMSLEPRRIDVGDRTRIVVQISEVNRDGVLIKLHFPDALSYVGNTASLTVDGVEGVIEPDVDVIGDNQDRYIVFFFSQADFGNNQRGTLVLELQADASVIKGRVEVDIDVDDPDINNLFEFSVDDPRFQVDDSEDIEVEEA
jgi:hypothetical protein